VKNQAIFQISAAAIQKWQEIVDLLAEILCVPSALIMKVEPPNIKVFVSSKSAGNPYETGELACLNTGLYCETVMKTRKLLLVPDALQDENWNANPDSPESYNFKQSDFYIKSITDLGINIIFRLGYSAEGKSAIHHNDPPPSYGKWANIAAHIVRHYNQGWANGFHANIRYWEIWNEPDQDGFWPPRPSPTNYVTLARETCLAVKQRVPNAVVVGPAAAQMPTVWRPKKPLFDALLADTRLLTCLDAISLHTHRFKQKPETVSRDYAVLRDAYLSRWPNGLPQKPIIDTEWGDSVYASGLTEDTQARWVARMYLVNLMEQVRLTNWYCLFDVGGDDAEMEHRFGLVRLDGTRRPAYQAYKILARQLGAMSLKQVIARFNQRTAQGASALVFCDTAERCVLAVWETEGSFGPRMISVPGWRRTGPDIDYLGREVASPISAGGVLEVEVQTAVRYVPVAPQPQVQNDKSVR